MKITLLPEQQKFLFENGGPESEYTFQEILDSSDWKEKKLIRIVHREKNEYGHVLVDCLTRNVFLETMKEGDEEYQRFRGAWDLNTTIHKLYALLDGKELAEAEEEIANISAQHTAMANANREFNNEQVEKIYALEQALTEAKTEAEVEKLNKKIEKLKANRKIYSIPKELKKMYFAARDKSKPEITFANVTPEAVKAAYGDDLIIA